MKLWGILRAGNYQVVWAETGEKARDLVHSQESRWAGFTYGGDATINEIPLPCGWVLIPQPTKASHKTCSKCSGVLASAAVPLTHPGGLCEGCLAKVGVQAHASYCPHRATDVP